MLSLCFSDIHNFLASAKLIFSSEQKGLYLIEIEASSVISIYIIFLKCETCSAINSFALLKSSHSIIFLSLSSAVFLCGYRQKLKY